jgi:hypothetical protein
MIYLRLFGDVLRNADEPKAAVEVLAAAGAGDKAAELATRLSELADMGYLLSRAFAGPVAAAAQVTSAQSQLIPDQKVTETATAPLDVAEKTWGPPGWGADPARRALEAVSRLGVRIPASLADPLLAIISPALTVPSGHTETAVSILVNLYLALPDRRAELAPRITALLSSPAVQPYIWGLLANLRATRIGFRPVIMAGAACMAIGLGWYVLRVGTTPVYLAEWLPGQLMVGLGIGLSFPVLSAAAVSSLNPERFAIGSAVNQTSRQIGGSLGIAILVLLTSQTTGLGTATSTTCGPSARSPRSGPA